ncbi:MAG: 4Fe-4S dicluster domain-containing protein [Bryobacteraceae bacterium]
MDTTMPAAGARVAIEVSGLASLIGLLKERGYQVVGPTVRDGAVTCDEVEKLEDLPAGWGDEQSAGRYRLKKREDAALFGYVLGPQGWKRYLHAPEMRTLEGAREGETFKILRPDPAAAKYAFLGVRACELAAIDRQDRILLGDRYLDADYRGRRQAALIIAVNCTQAGGTCFCTSMGTGPKVGKGFDIALTELTGPERHILVGEAGTPVGAELLAALEHRPASAEEVAAAEAAVARAAASIERRLDTAGLKEVLYESFEHPRWDKVATRCLSCANCTLVCPTCFCTTVEDGSSVAGRDAQRWRKWDSCFTENFSYIHGGSVRLSVKARYRQWLTHKLAYWIDQFGALGCVGCGRCITWCPGQIDITEEVAAIRGAEPAAAGKE